MSVNLNCNGSMIFQMKAILNSIGGSYTSLPMEIRMKLQDPEFKPEHSYVGRSQISYPSLWTEKDWVSVGIDTESGNIIFYFVIRNWNVYPADHFKQKIYGTMPEMTTLVIRQSLQCEEYPTLMALQLASAMNRFPSREHSREYLLCSTTDYTLISFFSGAIGHDRYYKRVGFGDYLKDRFSTPRITYALMRDRINRRFITARLTEPDRWQQTVVVGNSADPKSTLVHWDYLDFTNEVVL